MAAYPSNPPPSYQPAAPQYPPGVEVKQQDQPTVYSHTSKAQTHQAAMNPGYSGAYGQPQTVVVTQQQTQPTNGYGFSYFSYIPCLHMGGAVVVLVFNIIGVGLGTILSGFFLLCCGHPYSTEQSSCGVFALCRLISFLQISLTAFSVIMGWVFAIYWGILFITVSKKHYRHPFNPAGATSTTNLITA